MVATAALRKHTLFFSDGRVIDKEVVSFVLLLVCSIVLIGWTDCSEGLALFYPLVHKLVWCLCWQLWQQCLELHEDTLCCPVGN